MRILGVVILLVIVAFFILWRTATKPQFQSSEEKLSLYNAALKKTDPSQNSGIEPDSEIEIAALQRFSDFYRIYSADTIREGVRVLYAEDAYFGDPFKSVQGINDIEKYFLQMAEPVSSCVFIIEPVDRSGHEYYFRWVMELSVKPAKDVIIKAPGVSHVRFTESGQVIFQQDYWDSSVLMEKLPLIGGGVKLVKNRLE